MKINKINQDKIILAIELVCPILKEKLITEAFIVGSVAKGTAKPESDIDLIFYHPNPKKNGDEVHMMDINKYLHNNTKIINKKEIKHGLLHDFNYHLYKDELFHIMYYYGYDSNSIKTSEYLEITEEICNEVEES